MVEVFSIIMIVIRVMMIRLCNIVDMKKKVVVIVIDVVVNNGV